MATFVRLGMEPDEVAERVIAGIKGDELYILTNPEFRGLIEDRFQRILAAYPES